MKRKRKSLSIPLVVALLMWIFVTQSSEASEDEKESNEILIQNVNIYDGKKEIKLTKDMNVLVLGNKIKNSSPPHRMT